MTAARIAIALTIAGSDSSGGAGIQADLKTFSAFGVYGASAISALTAQNTRGVVGVDPVAASFVGAQIDAGCPTSTCARSRPACLPMRRSWRQWPAGCAKVPSRARAGRWSWIR
jgi:hypothetical protein